MFFKFAQQRYIMQLRNKLYFRQVTVWLLQKYDGNIVNEVFVTRMKQQENRCAGNALVLHLVHWVLKGYDQQMENLLLQ
jgi:hypothetical protein